MASRILSNISALSFSTICSRILGLLRDALFFASFGSNLLSSAFIIAFTIPNLFRRLLGEGALSSAFIPVFNQELENSDSQALNLLNQTVTRLALGLLVLVVGSASLYFAVADGIQLSEIWTEAAPMMFLLLPYAGLICCAAIFTAALNSLNRFFLPSLSPILLNLVMIAAMLLGSRMLGASDKKLAYFLCYGVLTGGILQLLLPAIQLKMMGWKIGFNARKSAAFNEVSGLFWTASGAAAAIQINLLITRIIAFQVSETAVSQLYIASRITEFPLGIFSIAITTVLFPKLAQLVSKNAVAEFQRTAQQGLTLVLLITIPASIGIFVLAKPIVALLFEWGRFNTGDVSMSAPVLAIFAVSVPMLSAVGYLTKLLHSQKKMGLALRTTLVSILVNLGFSLLLVQFFGVLGLAWAAVISATVQTALLAFYAFKSFEKSLFIKLIQETLLIVLSSLMMLGGLILMSPWFHGDEQRWLLLIKLVVVITASVAIYTAMGWCFRFHRLWIPQKDSH